MGSRNEHIDRIRGVVVSNQNLGRLFKPGPGAVPPYLAGRKREQEFFRDRVRALKKRIPIGQNMIVYGPRGNGKTALLRYLQKETLKKEGSKLDILWTTPVSLEHPEVFADLVIGDNASLRNKISFAFSGSGRTPDIGDLLEERCQSKPLILIIDEAHCLDPEMAGELLNDSQTIRIDGHPFLLVLAGTPHLPGTLRKSEAGFWERSKICRLGRLSPEEAMQAITIPLEKAGVSFAPGVAEQIVERTDSYPFFIQVWGNYIAERLEQTGARVISMDTVKEAEAKAIKQCALMFQDRRNEIRDMGLLAVAESVAHAFIQNGEPHLHESALKEAIERGMAGEEPITHERIIQKFFQLSYLGYIWEVNHPERGYGYEPGIPSLMSYVHRISRA